MATQQAFDAACGTSTPATQGPTSQDACTNALLILSNNAAGCTATAQNPTIICNEPCRGYYQAIIDNCAPAVSSLM